MSLRRLAEKYVQEHRILGIEFSGPTYQVEVLDKESEESVWVFIQFDGEKEALKDSFCSCSSDEEKCVHLEAALLKIYNGQKEPLHQRFRHSLWYHLCHVAAEHLGYEAHVLQKIAKGHFEGHNALKFDLIVKEKKIQELLTHRPKETPETSLKFSNLSQEEIAHWKEGRASPELCFELSLWSDLAKWMMREQEEGVAYTISFHEPEGSLPSEIKVHWPWGSLRLDCLPEDLPDLIPSLATVKSPLEVMYIQASKIEKITYNSAKRCLEIHHKERPSGKIPPSGEGLNIDGWLYVRGVGFFKSAGKSLPGSVIEAEVLPAFLDEHGAEVAEYIGVDPEPRRLNYSMEFDKKGRWHFHAYLDKKGDLNPDVALFRDWLYMPSQGFLKVEGALFDRPEMTLEPHEITSFINHHRLFLSTQEGFMTHLAAVEMPLGYEVTASRTLRFFSKWSKGEEVLDFDEWVYVRGQGFFAKKESVLGMHVRPGMTVGTAEIPTFIKTRRDELEGIADFFYTEVPFASRGLKVEVISPASIRITPQEHLHASFREIPYHLFGDYCYLEERGFVELPSAMRLPTSYQSEVLITGEALTHFLAEELPKLRPFIASLDPKLREPHRCDLEALVLVRNSQGGVRGEFYYLTELGKISVIELYEAFHQKRRFFFSEGGCLDLASERFQWIQRLKEPDREGKRIELSTVDFLRLDAVEKMLVPPETTPFAAVTRQLLRELREFITLEPAYPKDLKSELRIYQKTGLQWLWFLYRNALAGLLCDEMGLGKTHQAMALIASIFHQRETKEGRFLVVCPTSVIYHWQDKLEQFFPSLKVHVFHGLKRSLTGFPKEGLLLTSYGIVRLEKERLGKISFDLAVFDEIQCAKNPRSRIHNALLSVQAKMKLGLTGTPIENNLEELKALFDIVLPGYFPSEARYRELFVQPIERNGDEEKKGLLKSLIRPFILRRKKQEVLKELPDKTEDMFACDLSDEQEKLYKETLERARGEIMQEMQGGEIPYVHIFSILSKLKQICDHPALFYKDPDHYTKYSSGKWELFVELLGEAMESEEKVVVFSQYLHMLDIMGNYLNEQNIGYAEIRGATVDRRAALEKFQKDPQCRVFLGSLQAAGLGIDLTAASIVILYDRWWNAARENQAIDRVHRIGQKWGVQVMKLISRGTIEEKIDRLIAKKGRLMEEVVAADDQATLKRFTREELMELLSF